MQLVPGSTVRFIQQALFALDRVGTPNRSFRNYYDNYRGWRERTQFLSVDEASNLILELEREAKKEVREKPEYSKSDLGAHNNYPIFHDTIDVIPIYKDGVILECHRPLVTPSQIPGLLYLLKIPGYREGVDVENHGFGYHFHYGKTKSHTIIRTNLVMTFDPTLVKSQSLNIAPLLKTPLYWEQHAEGKCKSIEVQSIGVNKRLPIYLVCLEAGKKRGFNNFKMPSSKAKIFYDAA